MEFIFNDLDQSTEEKKGYRLKIQLFREKRKKAVPMEFDLNNIGQSTEETHRSSERGFEKKGHRLHDELFARSRGGAPHGLS